MSSRSALSQPAIETLASSSATNYRGSPVESGQIRPAKSCRSQDEVTELDADLAQAIAAWPNLRKHVRMAVLALIDSAAAKL